MWRCSFLDCRPSLERLRMCCVHWFSLILHTRYSIRFFSFWLWYCLTFYFELSSMIFWIRSCCSTVANWWIGWSGRSSMSTKCDSEIPKPHASSGQLWNVSPLIFFSKNLSPQSGHLFSRMFCHFRTLSIATSRGGFWLGACSPFVVGRLWSGRWCDLRRVATHEWRDRRREPVRDVINNGLALYFFRSVPTTTTIFFRDVRGGNGGRIRIESFGFDVCCVRIRSKLTCRPLRCRVVCETCFCVIRRDCGLYMVIYSLFVMVLCRPRHW